MSTTCKLASRFLRAVVNLSPTESQPWGRAMLRELDFIETPWGLLSWAMGSATALFACAVRVRFRTSFQEILGDLKRSGSKKTIGGLLSGLVVATMLLCLCVLGYLRLRHSQHWQLQWDRLMDRALIFVVPEAIYVLGIYLLWRRRKSAALGILLVAVILFTHVLYHHAMH